MIAYQEPHRHWALTVALIILSVSLLLPEASYAQTTKPNVVFILVDNVGWGDTSVYGGTVPTPRIDAIANEGIRFTNYTVEAQCTPSRSAVMTGRLPVRSGTTGQILDAIRAAGIEKNTIVVFSSDNATSPVPS